MKNYLLNQRKIYLILTTLLLITGCSSGGTATSSETVMCGSIPYPTSSGYITPSPILESSQVWTFISESNLHPMKVSVDVKNSGLADGLIFVAPYTTSSFHLYGQSGSLILDNDGVPIWFRPLNSPNLMNLDFKVQHLYDQPVLTFWQGTEVSAPAYTDGPTGSSEPGSCYYILNNHYQVIKTVEAQNGFIPDVHEFLITPTNSALFLATKNVTMDLTPYGGPQNGTIADFSIQEVDLATNKLVFFWDALDHIPIADTYESVGSISSSGGVWDVYHLNSIGLTDDVNDILVSARDTSAIYRINKPTGNIIWTLGGKQSDFTFESGAQFSWQHDARFISKNIISLFDDACCSDPSSIPPGTPYSRGLYLNLDFIKMRAAIESTYYHDPNLNVPSQGNVQALDNGNKFIGWGSTAYYSEFAMGGNTVTDTSLNLLYDAIMPGNNVSYRTFRNSWAATPYYPPSAVGKFVNNQVIIYASWNGSTETRFWQVYAGVSAANLEAISSVAKTGFETEIPLNNVDKNQYFQVKALDKNGGVIGMSTIFQVM